MKPILAVVLIGFALSLCNLSERFKKGSSSSGTSSSSSSSSDGPVERAQPTAAQTAAIAGGKEAKWERQGMSFTVPANWTGEESDSKSFMMRSPGGSDAASLIVSIAPMDENFPADSSLQAYYDSAKSQAKNGEVDEVKWVEIDGLKGVQFREASKEQPDDHRQIALDGLSKVHGPTSIHQRDARNPEQGFRPSQGRDVRSALFNQAGTLEIHCRSMAIADCGQNRMAHLPHLRSLTI